MSEFGGNSFIKLTLSPELITKQGIREKVWQYLEKSNLADFPRPVFNRIPNFKGSVEACTRACRLEVFEKAITVKVNPDKPQQHARFRALECGKVLLVPTPRLRSGLFNRITPPNSTKEMLRKCSTRQGLTDYSSPIDLSEKIKVDLIVIGSVAVSVDGYRIGKGEGYADMEYAMMMSSGVITPSTPVVTTVHDCQVFPYLPPDLFKDHDVPVDWIVTPTKTIKCNSQLSKPKGIQWELIPQEKLDLMPLLKRIKLSQITAAMTTAH